MRGTAGAGGCYTIPMGLCYGGGFWATTLALVLPLPGDYFPLEGPGVIGQQESVGGKAGHSLLTAFPYKCGSRRRRPMVREGVRESLADLLRQSLTAKGGNEGCWSGCYGRSAAENITDRRASTAFYIGPGTGTAAGTGHHRPESATSAYTLYRFYRSYRVQYRRYGATQ